MSIIKRIIRHFNGEDWDDYYPKTSADQVVFEKKDGSESNLQTEVLQMQEDMNGMADYIVENGSYQESSTSVWNWKKYSSGLLEIENYRTDVLFYFGTAYGDMYHSAASVKIPTQVPVLTGTLEHATVEFVGGNGLTSATVHSCNAETNNIGYYGWCPRSGNINKKLLFKIKARWK